MSHNAEIATVPLAFERMPEPEMQAAADDLASKLARRRTVRDFSSDPVPLEVIRRAIDAAGTAPSGANRQPWTFCLVTDPKLRQEIREAAEAEERAFYTRDSTAAWRADLAHLGTNADKPHLTDAPALIVVFAHTTGPAGEQNYYVRESVGIAVGILLATLHLAGLATLTHTPAPMAFLSKVLGRPANEKAYVLIPVGYPVADCQVPAITRKSREEILVEYAEMNSEIQGGHGRGSVSAPSP